MSQRNPGRRGFYNEGDDGDDDGGSAIDDALDQAADAVDQAADDPGGAISDAADAAGEVADTARDVAEDAAEEASDQTDGGASGPSGGGADSGGGPDDGSADSGGDSGSGGGGRSRSGIGSGVRGQPGTGGGTDSTTDPTDPTGGGRSRSGIGSGVRGQPGGTDDPTDDPGESPAPPRGVPGPSGRGDGRTGADPTPSPDDTGTTTSDGAGPSDDDLGPMADWRREYASNFERFGPEDVVFRQEQRPGGSFADPYIPESTIRETLQEDVASQAEYVDPDDVVVEQTEGGQFRASVPNRDDLYQEHLEGQAADQYGVDPGDVEASQQTLDSSPVAGQTPPGDRYEVDLTDDAAAERAREQLADQIEGADAGDIGVRQTESGGYEVATVFGEELVGTETIEADGDAPSVTDEQFSGGAVEGQTTDPTYDPSAEQPAGIGEAVVDVAQQTVEDPAGYVGGGTADFLTETEFVDTDPSMGEGDLDPEIADRLPGAAGDAAGYVGRSIDEGVRQFDRAAEVWDESASRGTDRYEEYGVPGGAADFIETTGRIANPAAAASDTVRATEAGTYVAVGAAEGPGEVAARAGEASDQAFYLGGTAVEAAQEDPAIIPAAAAGGLALGGAATGTVRATRAGARSARAGRVPGRTIPSRARAGAERARSGAANVASRTRAAAGEARAQSPVDIQPIASRVRSDVRSIARSERGQGQVPRPRDGDSETGSGLMDELGDELQTFAREERSRRAERQAQERMSRRREQIEQRRGSPGWEGNRPTSQTIDTRPGGDYVSTPDWETTTVRSGPDTSRSGPTAVQERAYSGAGDFEYSGTSSVERFAASQAAPETTTTSAGFRIRDPAAEATGMLAAAQRQEVTAGDTLDAQEEALALSEQAAESDVRLEAEQVESVQELARTEEAQRQDVTVQDAADVGDASDVGIDTGIDVDQTPGTDTGERAAEDQREQAGQRPGQTARTDQPTPTPPPIVPVTPGGPPGTPGSPPPSGPPGTPGGPPPQPPRNPGTPRVPTPDPDPSPAPGGPTDDPSASVRDFGEVDRGLLPGWGAETVTVASDPGVRDVSPSQSALEEISIGIRGAQELPTRQQLDEDEAADATAFVQSFGAAEPTDGEDDVFDFWSEDGNGDGGGLL